MIVYCCPRCANTHNCPQDCRPVCKMTDEELVRKVWKALGNLWWDREYDEYWISAFNEKGQPIRLFRGPRGTDAEAWAGAASFTRAHLEKVQQKREEIGFMAECFGHGSNCGCPDCGARYRIIAMLEAQLTELESGLTDWAKEHVEELLKEH